MLKSNARLCAFEIAIFSDVIHAQILDHVAEGLKHTLDLSNVAAPTVLKTI